MTDELTPEQKEEQRETIRHISLKTLTDQYILSLAAAGINKKDPSSGSASGVLDQSADTTLSKAPDQHAYEQLYGRMLQGGMAITNDTLKENAAMVYQSSILNVKVDDIYGIMGFKNELKEEYKDKYISDLDEKQKGEVVGMYMRTFMMSESAKAFGGMAEKSKSGLEDILCEKPTKEETQ